MCGICGVVRVGGPPEPVVAPELLNRMTDAMTHRGPDDRGVHCGAGVALGARRLSVVDLEGGHQPFDDGTGRVWAVQNGEIYNHAELRAELEGAGHRLASRCDTEVIPHLYRRHGLDFPERLRGMFGIAVWDAEQRRAVVVRDRLGIKPMYWARVGDLVLFASELKSLLAGGMIPGDLDYEAISAYLELGYVPGPRTPLAAVSKLMPGHRLVIDADGVHVEKWWEHPLPAPGPASLGVEHYAERLLAELDESIRLRLMADVPLGAMLSGGLDSSLIVALMAERMSDPVKTFSVGFAEDTEGNELAAARDVANRFGAEHHELELSMVSDTVPLPELVWHLDEPVADLSALGFLALSELAAKHVTVALSGQGADELLGGYRKHQAAALVGRYQRLPGVVRSIGERLASLAPARVRRAARTVVAEDPADRLIAMSGALQAGDRELFRGPLADVAQGAARRAAAHHLTGLDDDALPAALYLDAQLGLVDDMLHYFDRTSMAHSLEVRVPFLDHRFVEFCATIPPELKVRRFTTKHVLKEAARGHLPSSVIDKKKIGFFRPAVEGWFRSQADRAIADFLLDPGARYPELIDRGRVEAMLRNHRERGGSPARVLIAVLMLEVWLSTYLPRAMGS
jgi:asparagine synthase (glutamine-hydrolysing)